MLVRSRCAGISPLALLGSAALLLMATFSGGDAPRAEQPGGSQTANAAVSERVMAVAETGGIAITWPAASASASGVEIERRADGEAPRRIAVVGDTGRHLDAAAEVNRFYAYRVRRGGREIGVATGIRSDIRRPFVCPPLAPVPDDQLGVDRIETFETPTGRRVTVTVAAPRARPMVRHVPRCGAAAGCSDLEAIERAIVDVVKAGGGRVQLEAGRYRLRSPPGAGRYAHIQIGTATDLVLAGAAPVDGVPTTELLFEDLPTPEDPGRTVHGLSIGASRRVLIKDVALDWARPLAMPGRIEDAGDGTQRFVVRDAALDIPDPSRPPEVSNITLYDLAARTFTFRPRSRVGYGVGALRFSPGVAGAGQPHYIVPGRFFPNGAEAVALLRSGVAVRVSGGSSDIAFEGVHVWAGSSGFAIGPDGRGFRLSNVRVTRRPDARLAPGERPRLVSIRGDSSARGTRGELLVEASEFAFLDDDPFNVNGTMVQGIEGTRIVGDREIEFHFAGYNPFAHAWETGDTLALFDPATLERIGGDAHRVMARSHTFDRATNRYVFRFTLAEPVPALLVYQGRPARQLPFLAEPRHASPGSIFRRNCIHDTAAGRIVVGGPDTLIEDNVFANVGDKAVELSATPSIWREGPGADGAVVRRNRISGAGFWNDDVDHTGAVMARVTGWLGGAAIAVIGSGSTGFLTDGHPNRAIDISGNFVATTRGVGIVVAAASGVRVHDNVVVNSGVGGFLEGFEAAHCGARSRGFSRDGGGQPWCIARTAARGAIMVTATRDAQVAGNVTAGNAQGVAMTPQSAK